MVIKIKARSKVALIILLVIILLKEEKLNLQRFSPSQRRKKAVEGICIKRRHARLSSKCDPEPYHLKF